MILAISICLIGISFGKWVYRNNLNIISVFFLLWLILSVTAKLGLYGTNPLSVDTYLIISCGLLSFLIGMIFASSKQFRSFIKSTVKVEAKYILNTKFLVILYIISVLFLAYQMGVAITMLKSGLSFMHIRYLATSPEYNELRTSTIIVLLQNYIVTPTVYIAIAIMPLEMLTGNRNKLFLLSSVALMVMWVITTGGRSVLIWMLIYFTYSYMITNKNIEIPKKIKRIGIGLAVILFVILVITTRYRKGSDTDFIYQIYQYFSAPLAHFEYRLQELDSVYHGIHGYGLASWFGFIYLFLYPLHVIGMPYPELVSTIRFLSFTNLEEVVHLSSTVRMNAYVTTFFQFYLDAGIIGVIIGSMLFGAFTVSCYRVAISYDNKRWQLLFLLMAQKLLFSFVRFYFSQPTQAVAFILAFFIYKRNHKITSQ